VKYGNILFQNKIVILAELGGSFNLGIPSPVNIPRSDGFKIRLMNNLTSGSPVQNNYILYTLDNNYGFQTLIQYMYVQTYLTLIWKEADQTWYPIRDIIEANSLVTIAKPFLTTTEMPATIVPTTEMPATIVPTTEMPTTMVPTTEMPTTMVPTTEMPTTEMPTTIVPTTEMPATVSPTTATP
jgi:hypothetical protein